MPKFNGAEVTEEEIVDYFRSRGKRVVTEEDYEKKASAANDLSKLRNITGDSRSIEEIAGVVKGHKDLQTKLAETEKVLLERTREVKVRDINAHIKKMQGDLSVKVVDQFLTPFMNELYDADLDKMGKEAFEAKAKEVIAKASEMQTGALKELGIDPSGKGGALSFGSGGRVPEGNTGNVNDITAILTQTAASASGAGIAQPVPDWMRAAQK